MTTISEDGAERRVVVTNRLTETGRKLVNRPGGVKIQVQAKIRVAGSDETVTGTGKTTLFPAALVIAPADGLFAVGSAAISDKGRRYLDNLRGKLDGVKRISCVGFTDTRVLIRGADRVDPSQRRDGSARGA